MRATRYMVVLGMGWLMAGACGDVTTIDVPAIHSSTGDMSSAGGAPAAGGVVGTGGTTTTPPPASTGGTAGPGPGTGGAAGDNGSIADLASCTARCRGNMKVCDVATLTCVQCLSDADCPGHKTCGPDL